MDHLSELNYNRAVGERLSEVMRVAGLEIQGLAMLLNKSESHVYSLISGRRAITTRIANDLEEKLGFDANRLFRLNLELPKSLEESEYLNKFKKQYQDNREYFVVSRPDRKLSFFLEYEILPNTLFDKSVYVWEVKELLRSFGKDINSDTLSKHLKYFVSKGILRSEKRRIRRRNGEYGERLVDVFLRTS